LGCPGLRRDVLEAVEIEIRPGISLKVSSPEDLIIQKAIVGRPQDASDMESIVIRQGDRLDVAYIRKWLKSYAEILGDERIVDRFERASSKYKGVFDEG
jgi:predicted nucleotidyltransferase